MLTLWCNYIINKNKSKRIWRKGMNWIYGKYGLCIVFYKNSLYNLDKVTMKREKYN